MHQRYSLAPVRDGRVWVSCYLSILFTCAKQSTVIELVVFVDVNSAQFDSAQVKLSVNSTQVRLPTATTTATFKPARSLSFPPLPSFPSHRLVLENPVFFTSFHLPCLLPAPFSRLRMKRPGNSLLSLPSVSPLPSPLGRELEPVAFVARTSEPGPE